MSYASENYKELLKILNRKTFEANLKGINVFFEDLYSANEDTETFNLSLITNCYTKGIDFENDLHWNLREEIKLKK